MEDACLVLIRALATSTVISLSTVLAWLAACYSLCFLNELECLHAVVYTVLEPFVFGGLRVTHPTRGT